FKGEIVSHRTLKPIKPKFAKNLPDFVHDLTPLLEDIAIDRLFVHQKKAMDHILAGRHTIIATSTASGKTLSYNLPVIDRLLSDSSSKALYLFPLKALARDQLDTIQDLLDRTAALTSASAPMTASAYDGDVSAHHRTRIRQNPPGILLTNPEMLHLAMLAHHHLWEDYFRNLTHVIIDEVHTYRGVMGSNMAWVFRRLRRICQFYGSDPVFIFCSATIANPKDLCLRLTGLDAALVDESGAPSGQKDVLLMRGSQGAAQTAITLIHAAVHRKLRIIVYTQSRKITELIAMWASQRTKQFRDRITAYRAGFLPEERRSIEKKLSCGELYCVVSTSALELGIDIGSLDLCILVGYPGTIMSTWQRAGRVGRDGKPSALVLIAHEDALDQYFMNHPDIFFTMPAETALINPDNPMICTAHLECAAAELALRQDEAFLDSPVVKKALKKLEHAGRLQLNVSGDIWHAARTSPHREVSLRSTGTSVPIFMEKTRTHLGDIDRYRAFFDTHEGAVYLHHGRTYEITRFDYDKNFVEAIPRKLSYYTRARSSKTTRIISIQHQKKILNTQVGYGLLRITEQVTGYDRKLVSTGRSLGIVPLDLPSLEFKTQGMWIQIPDAVKGNIESAMLHFMGGIHAMEHAAIGIIPLLVMTDRNDLGGISTPFHSQAQSAAVFIYDAVPGGLGLCRQAFDQAGEFICRILDAVSSCPCDTGCPACVHSPKCGSGNRPIDKTACIEILKQITAPGKQIPSPKQISIPDTVPETPPADPPRQADPFRKDQLSRLNFTEQADPAPDPAPDPDPSPALSSSSEKNPLRYGVLDIETRRSAADVGGWNKAEKMGVSCAVLYDSNSERFHNYAQEEIKQLCIHLQQMDLVIGFNILKFDYKVLNGVCDFNFHALPTLDLLVKIHGVLGYRLSLDHLAQHTLGTSKSADGLMALKWWKQGKIDKIIAYCTQDVRVTRDIYMFGRENRFLIFKNKAGSRVRLPVSW
ncbi:MAG: DEAD/DEAH box helicase, partial [Desulfobacteraceae bacterium]